MRPLVVCCTGKHGWVRVFGRLLMHWSMTAPLFSERENVHRPNIRLPIGRYGLRIWFGGS